MKLFKAQKDYHYLVAGFQDITLDTAKLQFHLNEIKDEIIQLLDPQHYNLIEKLFLPSDNNNLLNFLQKTNLPFDVKGKYNLEEFEENLKEPASLPDYMLQFMKAYVEKEKIYPDLSDENELNALFYEYILSDENDFLRNWYEFNMNIKNIMTVLVCRRHEHSYDKQIIGNTETTEVIRKSQARDFGLGAELTYIDELINISRIESLMEREKAIDQLKWKYLDEHTFFEYFTVEKVMSFVLKTAMVERWLSIDKEYGNEMFRTLLNELENSYKSSKKYTEE